MRWSGLTRYAASWVSLVSPASVQPRAPSASIGPLASCMALGRAASSSQAPRAASPSGVRVCRSIHAALPSGAATATPLASPVPRAHVPATDSPARWSDARCSATQAGTASGATTSPSTSKPSSASGAAASTVAKRRSRRTRNSSPSKTVCTSSRAHWVRWRSSTSMPTGLSLTSWLSRRLRSTWSRWSRSDWPALPGILSMLATMPSRSPYWVIHFAAVLGPTPGTPGRLSDDSPDHGREVAVAGRRDAVLLLDLRRVPSATPRTRRGPGRGSSPGRRRAGRCRGRRSR